MKYYKNYCYF